jgi:hypothetical protein
MSQNSVNPDDASWSATRRFVSVEFLAIRLILPAAPGPRLYSASNGNRNLKIFLGSRARPVCGADNLTATCEPIVCTMWDPRLLNTTHGLLQG